MARCINEQNPCLVYIYFMGMTISMIVINIILLQYIHSATPNTTDIETYTAGVIFGIDSNHVYVANTSTVCYDIECILDNDILNGEASFVCFSAPGPNKDTIKLLDAIQPQAYYLYIISTILISICASILLGYPVIQLINYKCFPGRRPMLS
jgi:hypothetical protein